MTLSSSGVNLFHSIGFVFFEVAVAGNWDDFCPQAERTRAMQPIRQLIIFMMLQFTITYEDG
jgi:hypothetical protein